MSTSNRPAGRAPRRRGDRLASESSQSAGGGREERRSEYVPPAKKGAHPVVIIGTAVLLLGALVAFLVALSNRPDSPNVVQVETTNEKEYREIQQRTAHSRMLRSEAAKMRGDDDLEAFAIKCEDTLAYVTDTLDMLDKMLEPVREENSGELPPEYHGYQKDYRELQLILEDIVKIKPLFSSERLRAQED